MVRYIDDFVLCFQYRADVLRAQEAVAFISAVLCVAGSNMLEAGADLQTIQVLLGHSKLEPYDRSFRGRTPVRAGDAAPRALSPLSTVGFSASDDGVQSAASRRVGRRDGPMAGRLSVVEKTKQNTKQNTPCFSGSRHRGRHHREREGTMKALP